MHYINLFVKLPHLFAASFIVYLLRVTNVSGNSLLKKILNGQKKAKHTIELKNVSYVKNALKTNQEEIGTKLLTTK